MHEICGIDHIEGPFDECLACKFLGNACSGPRTSAMSNERWVAWCKALKNLRGYSNADCVEGTGLGKTTIDDIFAGKKKDVNRTTAGLLEDFLIGGNTKWACAMRLTEKSDVVYQDRPETLATLRDQAEEIKGLKRYLDDFTAVMQNEVGVVREEYQRKIDFLRAQVEQKDKVITKLLEL